MGVIQYQGEVINNYLYQGSGLNNDNDYQYRLNGLEYS